MKFVLQLLPATIYLF